MTRTRIAIALLLVALGPAACSRPRPPAGPTPPPASPSPTVAPDVTVAVDASGDLGAFNNPARYHNQADHAQLLTDAQVARVRELAPVVTRAWISAQWYYDPAKDTYDFDYRAPNGRSLYGYLDQVSSYTQRLFLNLNQCDQQIMDLASPQRCAEAIYQGIRHYKQRYPAFEFLEVFNEPDRDWPEPAGTPRAMDADTYYGWYAHAYRAVNRVNAELRPQVPLKVGGPVTYYFDKPFIRDFLARYAADTDPAKRLDFVSYHQYKARTNPASVAGEKREVQQMLTDLGLPDLPVYVTELGVFPGANSGTTFDEDMLTQSAAAAVLGNTYATWGLNMPMHWLFDHPTNDRKSMFVEGSDSAVTPYYNVVAMQRMLRERLVPSTVAPKPRDGRGVHAWATADAGSAAVMLTNYTWTDRRPQSSREVAAVQIGGLPPALRGRDVRVEVYLVDRRHSNVTAGAPDGRLERVADTSQRAGERLTVTVELGPNASALVVITPR
ncbi:GH39 family glycosyl hydrolase [Catellatospora vulcania]|uniref:GH39 family glycosyl hydrolase n=1 Tax=Catellatospora vulcania TaxID=1460450 RepID=UPI0012D3FD50|nr:hypothetical protein [Catellatospora vulcania]